MSVLFIGLMSGTSMDAVDAVLVDFSKTTPILIAHHSEPMPAAMLGTLQQLMRPGNNEVNELGQMDRKLAELFASSVKALLEKTSYEAQDICAIGSHGQTIRHMPNLPHAFTWQIADPNTLAVLTGIDVIADFRRKDIALGGQGAPLVPAFHHALFAQASVPRFIVNIGGIANITFLDGAQKVLGFDTGPGNGLMDAWIQLQKQQNYDKDGAWAAQGSINQALLDHLLSDEYFFLPAPKSTGKEYFNLTWLEQKLSNGFTDLSAEDVQATLVAFTVHSLANDIQQLAMQGEVYVCGGGAYNPLLMQGLTQALPQHQVATTTQLGVDPQWMEGMAFAWLAMRYHHRLPGNLPAVTGASRPAILGSRYYCE